MVVADPALEPRGRTGRLDPADQARVGEGVQRVVDGLQRDVPHALAHPVGDRLGVEVPTVAYGLEQGDAGGRDP